MLFFFANSMANGSFNEGIRFSCSNILSLGLMCTSNCSLASSGFMKLKLSSSICIEAVLSIILVIHFIETHNPENLDNSQPKSPYSNKS